MATATLQYRVDGGALHTDSIPVSGGAVLSFTAASFAGWQRARFEIVAFPPDWPHPSGWSTDASSGLYYYLANSGPSGVMPPDVAIPDERDYWGKWLFQLTVNSTIKSAKIGVETVSPSLGLHDKGFGESTQFGAKRGHVGPEQQNLRELDDFAGDGDSGIGAAAVLVDDDAAPAAFPSAKAIQLLAATLAFLGAEVLPVSITRRDAAGTSVAGLSLNRTITSNAAGAIGEALEIAFSLTDSTPSLLQVGRLRYEMTAVTSPNQKAKFVLSTRTTDGEHDCLTVEDTGNVVLNVTGGTARTLLCEGTSSGFTVGAAQRIGTGANNGTPLTLAAAQGQAQSGGSANNSGGALTLASGTAGTGGGGAAGTPGAISLKTGATERFGVAGDGSLITLTATTIKVAAANGIQADGGLDTATATTLYLGTNNANALSVATSGIPISFLGDVTFSGAPVLPAVLVGSLPSASPANQVAVCTNQTGGQGIVTSNGSIWVSDRTGVAVV